MPDGVDGAFGRRSDRRDADIDSIRPNTRAGWEKPLRCAARSSGTWSRETHHPALGTSCGNIIPAFIRRLIETQ